MQGEFWGRRSSGLNSKNKTQLDLGVLLRTPNMILLNKTFGLIVKLFHNVRIRQEDLGLSIGEKKIMRAVIRKKFSPDFEIEFNQKCINKIRGFNLFKKNEDAIKFIYKKAIHGLKHRFKNQIVMPGERNQLTFEETGFRFYKYYFEKNFKEKFLNLNEKAKNEKSAIVRFFEKKITLKFFKSISKNKTFLSLVIWYLENEFFGAFEKKNKVKIRNMVTNWEKNIQNSSEKKGISFVLNQIQGRGNKIPWTLSEVKNGADHLLKELKKIVSN